MCAIHHRYWVIGRSLIRTFMADATKDAAVYEMSDEQAQKKKLSSAAFIQRKADKSYKVTTNICNLQAFPYLFLMTAAASFARL